MFDWRALNNPGFLFGLALALWFASAAIRLVFARRKQVDPSVIVALLVLGVWAFCHAATLGVGDTDGKLRWLGTQLVLEPLIPPLSTRLVFVMLEKAGRQKNWLFLGQLLVAAGVLALTLTNNQHQLIWQNLTLNENTTPPVWIVENGWVRTFHIYYGCALFALQSLWVMMRTIRRPDTRMQQRQLFVLVGATLALAISLVNLRFFPGADPAAWLILSLAALTALSIPWLASSVSDLHPIARHAIFDEIAQGVLVLDAKAQIVDVNRAGLALLGRQGDALINHPLATLQDVWPEMEQLCRQRLQPQAESLAGDSQQEIGRNVAGLRAVFAVRTTALYDERGQVDGWMIVFEDISKRKRNEEILCTETRRLNLLYKLSHSLNGALSLNALAKQAVELTCSNLNLEMGELAVLADDDETLRVVAISGQSDDSVRKINECCPQRSGQGISGSAAQQRQLIISADLARHTCYAKFPNIYSGLQSGVAIPLLVGADLAGVLTLYSRHRDEFQKQDIPLFNAIALSIGMAIQNIQRFAETESRSAFLEQLSRLSTALRLARNHQEVMAALLEECMAYFRAEEGDIATPTEDGDDLKIVHYRSAATTQADASPAESDAFGIELDESEPLLLHKDLRLSIDQGLYGRVFTSGEALLYHHSLEERRGKYDAAAFQDQLERRPTAVSALLAPLRDGATVVGVLSLWTKEMQLFTEDKKQALLAFAEIGGQALQRAHLLETLEQRVAERTQDLAAANQQLAELDELKNEFIASVNHELRTPLSNIKLYLSLLSEGREERRGKYLAVLQSETEHLTRLLDTSLEISKLDEMRRLQGAWQKEAVNLGEVISSVVASYSPQAQAKGLEISVNAPTHPVYVAGNREQLLQALANLLKNAVDYSEHGGIRIELTLKSASSSMQTQSTQTVASLSISDSGYGISASELPKIWQRFYRGKRVRHGAYAGYGLGLSIVKEIVDLHHGSITVHSQENQGSVFEIRLPIWATASSPNTNYSNNRALASLTERDNPQTLSEFSLEEDSA